MQVRLLLSGLALVRCREPAFRRPRIREPPSSFSRDCASAVFTTWRFEFIDQLRTDPTMPAELKVTLDYQEGRLLIDEADRTGDLARRRDLLQQARTKLENFARTQPNHPLSRDALVQIRGC